jgi:glycosyltransferase involved in cell wall biosynthesis
MKIGILYELKEGPWGGANQFLKALRNEWQAKGVFADNLADADAVLINSHHELQDIVRFKYNHPNIPIIHRVDGPVAPIRGINTGVDEIIYDISKRIADATIFQSEWSKECNKKLGMGTGQFETTILNAPDPKLFYSKNNGTHKGDKTKIILSSWASNTNKGFDIYHWLDENLDFSRYEVTFVGNAPTPFKNIKQISAVGSKELGDLLRQHDIYITASKKDPCSNALLEALHCGLPAIAMRDGGHPEIVGEGGEMFDTKEEIVNLLERVAGNLVSYQSRINLPNLNAVAYSYQVLIEGVVLEVQRGAYKPKTIEWWRSIKMVGYYNSRIVFSIVRRRIINLWKDLNSFS